MRSILIALFFVLSFVLSAQLVTAGGGWIRERGSGYMKLGATTLSATNYHEADGSTSERFGKISTQTVFLYGEFGIAEDVEAIVQIPLFKANGSSIYNTVMGIGDIGLGARIPIVKKEWPVALGALLELPTGSAEHYAPASDGSDARENMPTGDGELNAWVFAAVSRSFFPFPGFATLSAGYNFRSLAVTEFTSQFDGGNLTNTYYVELEAGAEPWENVWFTGRFRRYAPAGTPVDGRFSFFGLGEFVEFNAWFLGAAYKFDSGLGISLDYSNAFSARAIYAGANIIAGISYEW